MDDNEQVATKQEKAPGDTHPTAQSPIDPHPPQEQDAAAGETDTSDKITKSDRIMIAATIVIALGTLVSAGAICFQWYEMHTGGVDTHDLAVAASNQAIAAGKQADAAKALAEQAQAQTVKMTESLTKTDNLIKATQALAVQTKRSADAARLTLETQERPRLGILRTPGNAEESPFSDSSPYSMMTARLLYSNFGKSPANNVVFAGTIDASAANPIDPIGHPISLGNCEINPAEREGTYFEKGKAIQPRPLEALLFPQQAYEEAASGAVAQDALRKIALCKLWLYAIGCIDYDDPIVGIHHQTLFCFYYVPKTKSFTGCREGNKTRDGEYWKRH